MRKVDSFRGLGLESTKTSNFKQVNVKTSFGARPSWATVLPLPLNVSGPNAKKASALLWLMGMCYR